MRGRFGALLAFLILVNGEVVGLFLEEALGLIGEVVASFDRFFAREIMVRSVENRGVDQAAFDNSWLIPRLGLDRYPITVVPPQQIPQRRCVLCRHPE